MTKETREILLPGGLKQSEQLFGFSKNEFGKILVAGESSEQIAARLAEKYSAAVELIVEDYSSLLNAKIVLENSPSVFPKIMEFERTDYEGENFDLIYAQASFTRENRKKIIKEMKRILKKGGILSVGEIVLLKENPPRMISDLLEWAGLEPLLLTEIESYYQQRGFEILASETFGEELPRYYKKVERIFETRKDELSEQEKSYYKKLIHRISHEANVFLKFGGEKFLAFHSFLAEKK